MSIIILSPSLSTEDVPQELGVFYKNPVAFHRAWTVFLTRIYVDSLSVALPWHFWSPSAFRKVSEPAQWLSQLTFQVRATGVKVSVAGPSRLLYGGPWPRHWPSRLQEFSLYQLVKRGLLLRATPPFT